MAAHTGPGFTTAAEALAAQKPKQSHQTFEEMEAERIAELKAAQAPFARILRCYDEATLFISTSGRAMTAWRWWDNGRWRVTYESGFRAFPSDFCSRGME